MHPRGLRCGPGRLACSASLRPQAGVASASLASSRLRPSAYRRGYASSPRLARGAPRPPIRHGTYETGYSGGGSAAGEEHVRGGDTALGAGPQVEGGVGLGEERGGVVAEAARRGLRLARLPLDLDEVPDRRLVEEGVDPPEAVGGPL